MPVVPRGERLLVLMLLMAHWLLLLPRCNGTELNLKGIL